MASSNTIKPLGERESRLFHQLIAGEIFKGVVVKRLARTAAGWEYSVTLDKWINVLTRRPGNRSMTFVVTESGDVFPMSRGRPDDDVYEVAATVDEDGNIQPRSYTLTATSGGFSTINYQPAPSVDRPRLRTVGNEWMQIIKRENPGGPLDKNSPYVKSSGRHRVTV